jgi:hypothetical protein
MTLVEFLNARLDEDESIARRAEESPGDYRGHPSGTAPLWTVSDASAFGRQLGARGSVEATPGRVLAEVEAKRRIVKEYQDVLSVAPNPTPSTEVCGYAAALEGTMAMLTLPYVDHPDYDSWRP